MINNDDTHKRGGDSLVTLLGTANCAVDTGEVGKPSLAASWRNNRQPAQRHRPASLRRGAYRTIRPEPESSAPAWRSTPAPTARGRVFSDALLAAAVALACIPTFYFLALLTVGVE